MNVPGTNMEWATFFYAYVGPALGAALLGLVAWALKKLNRVEEVVKTETAAQTAVIQNAAAVREVKLDAVAHTVNGHQTLIDEIADLKAQIRRLEERPPT